MREWFIRLLLAALEDERVRVAVAEIIAERQARDPKFMHRPISKNKAPGAI